MSTEVGALHYDLDIPLDKLESSLDKGEKEVKGFADRLHDGLMNAAKGFAVVGAGLTLVSKNATDFTVAAVSNARSLSREIGVSTEEASRLTAAFQRMGISAENASQMFGVFSRNIVKATEENKNNRLEVEKLQVQMATTRREIDMTTQEIARNGDKSGDLALKLRQLNNQLDIQQASLNKTADGFARLGISTTNADGAQKDFNTLLFEVADRFKELPDGIDKTAISMELFGRSGKDMIKVLNLGSDGIRDLEEQADKLGLTLSADTIASVQQYVQSQKDLKQSTDSLKIAIGTATAPILTDFNKALADMATELIGTDGPMRDITVSVIAFGGPMFAAASGVLTFVANLRTAAPMIVATTGRLLAMAAAGLLAAAPYILIGAAIAGLVYIVVTNWDTIKNAVIGGINAIYDAVNNFRAKAWEIVSNIVGFFQELPGKILGAVVNFGTMLFRAGSDLVNGLIRGIREKIADLAGILVDGVKNAVGKVKGFLGIHSPSTLFQDIGHDVTAGFVKGINDSGRLAMNAMDRLAGNVIAPALTVSQATGTSQQQVVPAGANTTNINIGAVNDKSDADYIFNRMDRSYERAAMGISI